MGMISFGADAFDMSEVVGAVGYVKVEGEVRWFLPFSVRIFRRCRSGFGRSSGW